jgi:hypothetical protein
VFEQPGQVAQLGKRSVGFEARRPVLLIERLSKILQPVKRARDLALSLEAILDFSQLASESDLSMFQRFRIDEGLLEAAGVRRVTQCEAFRDYGINLNGRSHDGGILYPYVSPVDGARWTARLRQDCPSNAKDKYLSPYLDHRYLFFPPGSGELLRDKTAKIVFVESEKAALALMALAARQHLRILPIATGGCYGWRGRIGIRETANGAREEERGPLPDLSLPCWPGRQAIILFDSNVGWNPQVRQARRDLAGVLEGFGAKVLAANIPKVEGVNGPDDLIAVSGDDALVQSARGCAAIFKLVET